jgi:hypothetical protein
MPERIIIKINPDDQREADENNAQGHARPILYRRGSAPP